MASTRITISFSGRLTAQAQPVGSQNVVAFAAESNYDAAGWQAGSLQDAITGASFVALPWRDGLLAEVIGIQVRSGPALRVRLTREDDSQEIVDAAPSAVLTFPEDRRIALLEVAGAADETTEFEWLAAGT